jgi:hypothetical protein
MRDSILTKLKTISLGGFSVSNELPFSESGTELYIKNAKTIYVDRETTETVPLVLTLDGSDIATTTTSVVVYFSTDAKNAPSHLDTLITNIKGIKNNIDHPGANQRDVNVRTSFEGDQLINEVEFRFTRTA